jgi:alkylation response protein AidB-like acyl-CoA dehydrogenase
MDFDLSEEQKILKKAARDFLVNECPKEVVRSLDESEAGYSPELWKKMAELGWMGLIFPEAYGGSGFSFLDLVGLLRRWDTTSVLARSSPRSC